MKFQVKIFNVFQTVSIDSKFLKPYEGQIFYIEEFLPYSSEISLTKVKNSGCKDLRLNKTTDIIIILLCLFWLSPHAIRYIAKLNGFLW